MSREVRDLLASFELYDGSGVPVPVDGQYSCKGDYHGDLALDLAELLGSKPLYIDESRVSASLSGSRESASGLVKLELRGHADAGAYAVTCSVSTAVAFTTP